MKNIIRLIALLLCIVCFCGCISAKEKQLVEQTVNDYFLHLKQLSYESANEMTVKADESISNLITSSKENDFLFQDISYEIWSVGVEGDMLYADVVVNQHSMSKVYSLTVAEYAEYAKKADVDNKSLTKEELKEFWDNSFYKNISENTERVSTWCRVYIQKGEPLKILMTKELRNALFGGALNAINALSDVK